MEIRLLSPKRGITALYDGNRYIIHSSFYGVVAESKPIKRYEYDKKTGGMVHLDDITIEFDICEWFGYWSLKDIITRGIKKIEQEWEHTATITYNEIKGEQGYLHRHLKMTTEQY